MGPFTAIGEFFVPPLHILLNKIGQLSVAMAGERVLSTGYSLSEKNVQWIHHLYYKPTAKRIAQAVCGHFLSFLYTYVHCRQLLIGHFSNSIFSDQELIKLK